VAELPKLNEEAADVESAGFPNVKAAAFGAAELVEKEKVPPSDFFSPPSLAPDPKENVLVGLASEEEEKENFGAGLSFVGLASTFVLDVPKTAPRSGPPLGGGAVDPNVTGATVVVVFCVDGDFAAGVLNLSRSLRYDS
jgi:hypothetical protein